MEHLKWRAPRYCEGPCGRAGIIREGLLRQPHVKGRQFLAALRHELCRIRVPRFICSRCRAIAARRDSKSEVAGAPGFEPGITGSKPVALPLGHAPAGRIRKAGSRTPKLASRIAGHGPVRPIPEAWAGRGGAPS